MVHDQEAHLGFLGLVLREPKPDYFDLLPQRAALGVGSGGCGRGFLHLDGATRRGGWLLLEILHGIIGSQHNAAESQGEHDAHQPGRQACPRRRRIVILLLLRRWLISRWRWLVLWLRRRRCLIYRLGRRRGR